MKKSSLFLILVRIFILSIIFISPLICQTITAKNVIEHLNDTKERKILALKYLTTNQIKRTEPVLAKMVNSEIDSEILFNTILAIAGNGFKSQSLQIVKIFEESKQGEVRFACAVALLELKDPRTLPHARRGYEKEQDLHIKLILELLLKSLVK